MTATTRQLRALADAAGQAGDTLQVAIAERAICSDARWDGSLIESLPLTADERERVMGMTREEALAECNRVIAEAQAQEGGSL